MGVSKLARLAALALLVAVPVVLWVIADGDAPPAPAPTALEPAPADDPPVLKTDVLAVSAAGRRQVEGGAVEAGERVRFRVHLDRPAHVLIGRRDRLGGAHLVYPLGMAGRAIAMPKGGPREVTQGLDKIQGEETIVTYACARSFTWGDVKGLGERAGCARSTQALRAP